MVDVEKYLYDSLDILNYLSVDAQTHYRPQNIVNALDEAIKGVESALVHIITGKEQAE